MQIRDLLLVDVNHSVGKDFSNHQMRTERRLLSQCSVHLSTVQRRKDRDSPLATFFCQCSNPEVRGSFAARFRLGADLKDPRQRRRRRKEA